MDLFHKYTTLSDKHLTEAFNDIDTLHAAWVWGIEHGVPEKIEDIIHPFVLLDESRRCRPVPEHAAIHRKQKEVFRALSARVRGMAGDDPFALRHKNI